MTTTGLTWRRRTAAVATVGLVGIGSTLFGVVGPGHAATLTKTLNYTCPFPVVGKATVPVTLNLTVTDPVAVGDTIKSQVTVGVGVPANVQGALPLIGATQADFSAALHTTWSGAISQPADGTLAVKGATPPATGTWTISGAAAYPDVPAKAAGETTLTAGGIDVVLTPRAADGMETAVGVADMACTVNAGQDATITKFTIA